MEKRNAKIRFWYGIYLGLFTVVLGILFIVSAAQIYYSDPAGDPYTRELAGEKLLVLLAPILLYILSVIAGYVLFLLFPAAEKRRKPSAQDALKKLRARVPEGRDGDHKKLNTYALIRRIVWGICLGFALLAGIMSIVYLADVSHFPAAQITDEILNMLRHVLPWVGAAFLLFIGATVYDAVIAKRELACVKSIIAKEGVKAQTAGGAVALPKYTLLAIRLTLLALGIAFLIWGICNGGMHDVFVKAINICTECIGLG